MRRASSLRRARADQRARPDAAARRHQSAQRLWTFARSGSAQAAAWIPGRRMRSKRSAWQCDTGTAYFLTPEGECFHRATVTGGKPASEGPLALKRELRETEGRLATIEDELAKAEDDAEALTRDNRGADCATGNARRGTAQGGERGGQSGRSAEADGNRSAAHRAALAGVGRTSRAQQGRERSKAAIDCGEARRSCAPGGRARAGGERP